MNWKKVSASIALLLILEAGQAWAEVFSSDNIAIHGFGGWAYGRTDNENRYLVGNKEGSYDSVNFALNISATLNENLGIHFQSSYNESFEEDEVKLDYAFAEWFFNEALIFRVGKIKAAHMLYTEVYNVGTLRPFYTLPQGLYHDFAAEAYKGVGFTGVLYSSENWEIAYDVYGGQIDLLPIRIAVIYSETPGHQDIYASLFGEMSWVARDMIGTRVTVATPIHGLSFGFSSFSGLVDTKIEVLGMSIHENDEERYTFYGTSGEYVTDSLTLRTEYLHNHEHDIKFEAGYGEIALKVTPNWQVALRQEFENQNVNVSVETVDNPFQEYLNKHRDTSFGLNYWFNANFVIKCSYHMVYGNRFANPDKLEDYVRDVLNEKFQERTNLILLGVNFSF